MVGHDRWDQHANLKKGHEDNAGAVDQPIAALLDDLKQRGLFQSTLVVWMGEFGRTPFAQGTNGRDHNPFGFSLWLAGGGVRGGTILGTTDEYGYKAIEHKLQIHDLHATMLHLLGMNHEHVAAERVTADVLMLTGETDMFQPSKLAGSQQAALTGARSVTTHLFKASDQAGQHCQMGNLDLALEVVVRWLR